MQTLSFRGNYIDLIAIAILLFYITEGFRVGFWPMLVDFLSFLFSLIAAFFLYSYFSAFLREDFALSYGLANSIGFLISAVLVGSIFNYLLTLLISKIPSKVWKNKWSYFFSFIPALGEALVVVVFLATLLIGLPINSKVKNDLSESHVGGRILFYTGAFSSQVNEIFGKAVEESLTYLTVPVSGTQSVPIYSEKLDLSIDYESEVKMLELVNQERSEAAVASLGNDIRLQEVARAYAQDMWERRFFSHYSPEGESVADRLERDGIFFLRAGENLALAPTVSVAHDGLMNSEGHRENILDSSFLKVGIGVVDNGIYGKIFVQVFTN